MTLTKEQRDENLRLMAAAAVAAEIATGCPALVSVAQCILESAWLEVAPGNNCFGIKDTDRYPGAQYKYTKEFENGTWVTHVLAFEIYPTLADCFADHAKLITGGFDPQIRNCYAPDFDTYKADGDLEAWVARMGHHYATDPAYAPKLLTLMHLANVIEAVEDARAEAVKPEPVPESQQAQGSWILALWQLFARLFKPRSQ